MKHPKIRVRVRSVVVVVAPRAIRLEAVARDHLGPRVIGAPILIDPTILVLLIVHGNPRLVGKGSATEVARARFAPRVGRFETIAVGVARKFIALARPRLAAAKLSGVS